MFRARMQREADTAGRLTEPHIVPIHDYGEIDGQFYVEMRLVDGTSLRSLLTQLWPADPGAHRCGRAPDRRRAGLRARQRRHPPRCQTGNILITKRRLRLSAGFRHRPCSRRPRSDRRAESRWAPTTTWPRSGSPATTSPTASDIYALACVLGECLTGAPPFRADSVERLIAAHLLEPAPQPSQLRPGTRSAGLGPGDRQGHGQKPRGPLLAPPAIWPPPPTTRSPHPSSTRKPRFCGKATSRIASGVRIGAGRRRAHPTVVLRGSDCSGGRPAPRPWLVPCRRTLAPAAVAAVRPAVIRLARRPNQRFGQPPVHRC